MARALRALRLPSPDGRQDHGCPYDLSTAQVTHACRSSDASDVTTGSCRDRTPSGTGWEPPQAPTTLFLVETGRTYCSKRPRTSVPITRSEASSAGRSVGAAALRPSRAVYDNFDPEAVAEFLQLGVGGAAHCDGAHGAGTEVTYQLGTKECLPHQIHTQPLCLGLHNDHLLVGNLDLVGTSDAMLTVENYQPVRAVASRLPAGSERPGTQAPRFRRLTPSTAASWESQACSWVAFCPVP